MKRYRKDGSKCETKGETEGSAKGGKHFSSREEGEKRKKGENPPFRNTGKATRHDME
jgi:hypothetical protein